MIKQKIIDTHLHFWDLEYFSLPWLGGVDALNRSFHIEEYQNIWQQNLSSYEVESIYMEVDVTPDQKEKEVHYISEKIKQTNNPLVGAVVSCHLGSQLRSQTDKKINDFIDLLGGYKEVKGIRQVLHTSTTSAGHCLTKDFLKALEKFLAKGYRFDLCIRPEELMDAVKLASLYPEGQFILDHCGNPYSFLLGGKGVEVKEKKAVWMDSISKLGEQKNVVCKLSGIIHQVSKENCRAEVLALVINHCIDSFGEERVVFGSDWPVCTLGAGLSSWVNMLEEIIEPRSKEFKENLFYKNAEVIYQLNEEEMN